MGENIPKGVQNMVCDSYEPALKCSECWNIPQFGKLIIQNEVPFCKRCFSGNKRGNGRSRKEIYVERNYMTQVILINLL